MNTDRIQRLNSLLERIKRNAALPKQLLGKGLVLSGAQAPRGDVSAGPSVPSAAPLPHTRPIAPKTEVAAESSLRPAAESIFRAAAESALRSQPVPPAQPAQVPPSPSISSANLPQAQAEAPPSPSISSANLPQAHSPMVAIPSVSGASWDGRKPRQRVATMIGVAVPPPPKEEAPIEEIEADEVELVHAASSPPAPMLVDAASAPPALTLDNAPSSQPTITLDDAPDSQPELTLDSTPPTEASPIEASLINAGTGQRVEPPLSQTETKKPDSDVDNLSWSEPPAEDLAPTVQPPPDSSRRPRIAGSIDEALAEVTDGTELEIPLKTPPPESGKQPAEGAYATSMPSAAVPTAEQLGDTLDLEEPTVAKLELDLGQAKSEPVKEELELDLPQQAHILEPPASEHRAHQPSHIQEIAVESGIGVTVASVPGDDTLLSDSKSLQLQPEVTLRKATDRALAVELLQSARDFAPQSFVELLDASLKLGGNSG